MVALKSLSAGRAGATAITARDVVAGVIIFGGHQVPEGVARVLQKRFGLVAESGYQGFKGRLFDLGESGQLLLARQRFVVFDFATGLFGGFPDVVQRFGGIGREIVTLRPIVCFPEAIVLGERVLAVTVVAEHGVELFVQLCLGGLTLLAHGLIATVAREAELVVELFTHFKNLAEFVLARLKAGKGVAHVAGGRGVAQLIFLVILWAQGLRHLGLALRAQRRDLGAVLGVAEAAIVHEGAFHLAVFGLEGVDQLEFFGREKTMAIIIFVGSSVPARHFDVIIDTEQFFD